MSLIQYIVILKIAKAKKDELTGVMCDGDVQSTAKTRNYQNWARHSTY